LASLLNSQSLGFGLLVQLVELMFWPACSTCRAWALASLLNPLSLYNACSTHQAYTMLTQLAELRQCSLNSSSLDNACLPSQAQALASLLTLLNSGFTQLAHLSKLGLQCQFSCWVWCHPLGQHQYYHPIKLGLRCRFGWQVWCHPLGQHQHHHWYLGIQLRPKEEGQPFDAAPLLREYQPFELNHRHLTFRQCRPPRYASPHLIAVAAASGSQKPVSLTLLTVTGAVGVKGGPSLAYVATNLTIGSNVGDNTFILSSEIPSSSMGSNSAMSGTGGILLTSNFDMPALFDWRYISTTSWYPYHKEASQAYRACDQKPCKFGLHWQTRRSQNCSYPAHAVW
jgi:hypothetical protein